MEINIIKGEKIVVELAGRLDTSAAPTLSEEIEDIVNKKNDVVFDCKELEYIASSGLRVFLQAQKALNAAGGTLKITNVQPTVQSVLDMTGFSIFLDLVN